MITEQQAADFIKDMQLLIAAPEFSRLSRYNQERTWLGYLPLSERHYCSLLEWLLNPQEGHGLGDFFLKQLLREAYTTALESSSPSVAEHFKQRLKANMWFDLDELLISSLHSAMVAQEVAINLDEIDQPQNRRMDLLIVDPVMYVVIVIERKDGSKTHSGQLKDYQKWVEKEYPDYYQLFILSDSRGLEHDLESSPDWIQLDDSWLIQSLKEALIPGRLPKSMIQRFEDLLYHFDWEGPYREPFYYGIEKELDQFSLTYRDTIQRLRKNPITKLRHADVLTSFLPDADRNEETEIRRALLLKCRYPSLIGDLLTRASLKELSNQLAKQHPDVSLAFDIHDETLNIGTQSMQSAWEVGDISDWPIYLTLSLPHQPPSTAEELCDSVAPSLPTLSLSLDLLFGGEKQKEQNKELAKKYGLSLRPRWPIKHQFDSIEAILDDPSRLRPWIQKMCAMARELGY